MSHQVWITCPKATAQDLKSLLGSALCRTQKIKRWNAPDRILVPTNSYRDEYHQGENTAAFEQHFFFQTLNLPLALDLSLSIVLIPKAEIRVPKSPIEVVVARWIFSLAKEVLGEVGVEGLLEQVPKRWSVYYPMVLLPTGSFQDENWKSLLGRLKIQNREDLSLLWEGILGAVEETEGKGQEGQRRLTHLAVNAGIPLHNDTKEDSTIKQNFLRSPSGLVMLYGDFGPEINRWKDGGGYTLSTKDFEEAFWVGTYQNGIYQTWAPRYTMFSRGNIKEKSRLLNFHNTSVTNQPAVGLEEKVITQRRMGTTKDQRKESVAVDMYAGIGYFVFSYVKMGMGKVVGFEINPWSVEGLRRGAVRNGWSVKVLNAEEISEITSGRKGINEVVSDNERIIVFQESNENAPSRISQLQYGFCPTSKSEGEDDFQASSTREFTDILHVNCGLLPTSRFSYDDSLALLGKKGGWMHLHENVAMGDIESKRVEIEDFFKGKRDATVEVEHVELVKTFAPRVWHCVFDVYVFGVDRKVVRIEKD